MKKITFKALYEAIFSKFLCAELKVTTLRNVVVTKVTFDQNVSGIIILNFDPTAEVWLRFWLADSAGREAFDASSPFLHLTHL